MGNYMNAIGGLAGGLANGINMGMQWKNQQQYLDQAQQRIDQQGKSDARDQEVHGARMEQYKSEKDMRDRRSAAFQQIADYTKSLTQPTQQEAPQAAQTQIPQSPLAGPDAMAQQPAAPGLATQQQPAMQQQPGMQQPQEQDTTPPAKILERGMVTGAYSPKALTDIAGIFAQNGLHEDGIKYMEQAYKAKKSGMVDAAMALAQNNPGGAVEALKSNGIEVDGLPVKVNPQDPNDHNWKYKLKGDGEKEQTVNATNILQSTMDPEKYLDAEDKKRKAAIDDRKQANDDRKTNAEIGYLRSRSSLADAKASDPGNDLRPSRSSEAQINTAMSRRDKAFDRISSSKDEEGKFQIDPQKRQTLDSAANQYQTFIEDKTGEEMTASQHHKFTDAMLSFPVDGTKEDIKEWKNKQLIPRMGGRMPAETKQAPAQSEPQTNLAPAQKAPAKQSTGTLMSLAEKRKGLVVLDQQMKGIQKALQSPNLDVNQKKALSLKAQEIASRRDSLK
ncbi:MAG: hypothetical protein ABI216_22190 [Devosia sp.]